jgi:hypothetical protein
MLGSGETSRCCGAPGRSDAHPSSPDRIMQVGLGFWASKTLLSAVELGLFSALAEAPADLETVRARLGLHPRAARDFLDALVALGFLEREDGLYGNTAETHAYLDRAKPAYIGGLLEMANRRIYGFWGALTEALRTGQHQNEGKAQADTFAATYADPSAATQLPESHERYQHGPGPDPRGKVRLGGAAELRRRRNRAGHGAGDIGTGLPASHRPRLRPAARRARLPGVRDRGGPRGPAQLRAGRFRDPLPRAEVLIMGHTLHEWDLPTKKDLLRKAYEALPSGGALIVYDAIIDDDRRENAFGLLMSLNMLIGTAGGFDYTGADCRSWMADAGFRDTRVAALTGPTSMVIGSK